MPRWPQGRSGRPLIRYCRARSAWAVGWRSACRSAFDFEKEAPMKMTIAILALFAAGPALAQKQGPVAPPPDKVNQVLVYGDQPCPKAQGDEIVVCVRSPDEPYRLPKALRGNPQAPENQSWVNRAKSVEYVSRSGTHSCSPVGAGGFTGCFDQIVKQAYAEKA